MKKLFYVRIDIVDLMDFATDPEGENMSLLTFAKELKKEKSDYPQIQRILNEAHRYIEQKKEAGKKSARLRLQKKKEQEEIQRCSNGASTSLQRCSNGASTEVNEPSTNNSNSNSNRTTLTTTIQGRNLLLQEVGCLVPTDDGRFINDKTGEISDAPF